MSEQNDASLEENHEPCNSGCSELIQRPQLESLVQQYIESGVNIGPFTRGKTSLRDAVIRKDKDSVRLLLSAGASPYVVDDAGDTPLLLAIRSGQIELVQLLLDAGADVNYVNHKSQRNTPKSTLHDAMDSSEEILQLLLERGADPNRANSFGMSVLSKLLNAKKINSSILRLLLRYGADMYNGGLHGGISEGISPFEEVLAFHRVDSLKIFLEHGADFQKYRTACVTFPTPLHHAVRGRGQRGYETLSLLIDHYKSKGLLDLECVNELGLSPLHLAVVLVRPDHLKLLLQAGADPNHADAKGRSPLETALTNDEGLCLSLLVEAGAKLGPLVEGLLFTSQHFILSPNESDHDDDDESNAPDDSDRSDVESESSDDSHDRADESDADDDSGVQVNSRSRQMLREKTQRIVKYRVLFESKGPVDDPIHEKMENAKNLRNYLESCKAELAILRDWSFQYSVTYYTVLTDEGFWRRVRSDRPYEAFDSENLREKLPIYFDDLNKRFLKGKAEHELWGSATRGLKHLLGIEIDSYHLIFYNILDCLCKKDLHNLGQI